MDSRYGNNASAMFTGVFSTEELFNEGLSRRTVRELVQKGSLIHLSRGWFARPDAVPDVARVVRLGGRVGCVTGCALHGIWTPRTPTTHGVYGRGSDPTPAANIEWHALEGHQPRQAVCELVDCLEHVIQRHDAEASLICLESATNSRLILPSTARALAERAPAHAASTMQFFDPSSQSGSETRVRLALQRRRVSVRSQVRLPGVGIVDLLVGHCVVIECDSDRHHSGSHVDTDRRRDMGVRRLGMTSVRLSYQQIWDTWPETEAFLFDLVGSAQHRHMPIPLNPGRNSA